MIIVISLLLILDPMINISILLFFKYTLSIIIKCS